MQILSVLEVVMTLSMAKEVMILFMVSLAMTLSIAMTVMILFMVVKEQI